MSANRVSSGRPIVLPEGHDAELEAAIPPVSRWRVWTASEEAKLRRYYPLGVPVATLAGQLGHPAAGVRAKVVELGLRRGGGDPRGKDGDE